MYRYGKSFEGNFNVKVLLLVLVQVIALRTFESVSKCLCDRPTKFENHRMILSTYNFELLTRRRQLF